MTIKKIIFASWVIVTITASLLFAALYSLQMSHRAIDTAYQSRQLSLDLARELQESSEGLTRSVRQYAVTGEQRFTKIYWDIVKVRAGEEARPANSAIAARQKVALVELMKQANFTQQELALLQQAGDLSNELIELETQAMHAVEGLFRDNQGSYTVKGVPDTKLASALVFSADYDSNVAKIMAPIKTFQQELNTRLDVTIQEKLSNYQQAKFLLVAVSVIWLFVFVGFLLLVKGMIVTPVLQCQSFATRIAQGELDSSLAYASHNEIGALALALKTMVTSLRERITHAEHATSKAEEQSLLAAASAVEAEAAKLDADAKRDGMLAAASALEDVVNAVSSASTELSAQIEQSERGSVVQASRVAETATAMEEMNSTVLEVSRNAAEAAKAAAQARALAEQGSHIARATVDSITAVQQQSLALKADMSSLGEHTRSISQIMIVISDIADQTNLLALNAAIEAARAGDAGRGFAVVADEVRKLAEKTMSATYDVSNAIQSIQLSADKNIEQVETAVQDIENATKLVVQSGGTLNEILRVVDVTADQMHTIATASEQQSAASEEINNSIMQVNIIANETSRAMQQSAQAVSDLAQQAQALSGLIGELKQA